MRHEVVAFALFVALLAGSVSLVLVTRPTGESGTFCKAYGNLYSRADVVEVGELTLLVNQGRRDPCGDDDLWHYDLEDDIHGVVFDDCLVSWVGGGRSSAASVGLRCEAGRGVLIATVG